MAEEQVYTSKAFETWDKLMEDTGALIPVGPGEVEIAIQALDWLNKRRREHEEQRLEIRASEMFEQKRGAICAALIKAAHMERIDVGAIPDAEYADVLRQRSRVPTQEQIALYWVLTGAAPPERIRIDRHWVEATAVNLDIEIRRLASKRGEKIPLDVQGARWNLIFAIHPTPKEAKLLGLEYILSGWDEERARSLYYGYEALRCAVQQARAAERLEMERLAHELPHVQRGLAHFLAPYRNRFGQPLQGHVAAYWSLTGTVPPRDWNRWKVVRTVKRLERHRRTPVNIADALERVCDIVQLPKRDASPLPPPNVKPHFWRLPKTVAWGTPPFRYMEAVTPWPNERSPFDPTAADSNYAPEIRSACYKPAMAGKLTIGDRFLGADGWYYVFVPEARSPHGKSTPMGRIIMRRGKYYDEIPVWLSSESPRALWDKLKVRRALPDAYAREFPNAILGNEEALHDFWSTVGFNPVGYVVGLERKAPGLNRGEVETPSSPTPSKRPALGVGLE
ncbi:MAG: hypothetical protein ACP5OR_03985 [Candidatus Dormibacteria bacterium]